MDGACGAPSFEEAGMSYTVPDVCTLPTAERPLRLAEFDELFATDGEAVILEVEVPTAYAEVLASLAQRADAGAKS